MSKIQVNEIVNHFDNGAPDCPRGLTIAGVATAATLDVTGNVSVGGTLTYDDVTNIDSVGIITAQNGINVSGGTLVVAGFSTYTGIATFNNNVKVGSKITLNAAAGSATILGSVDGIESSISNGTVSTTIKDGNTQDLYRGIKGSTTVFNVGYDGAITAAGTLNTGDLSATGGGNRVTADGQIFIRPADSKIATASAIQIYSGGDSGSDATITFKKNGDSEFTGIHDVGDASGTTGYVRSRPEGIVYIRPDDSAASSSIALQLFSGGNASSNSVFKITKGGEVTIKENILLGTFAVADASATGLYAIKDGLMYIQRANNANQPIFQGYEGTTNTFTINSDGDITSNGTATFAGTVQSPSINVLSTETTAGTSYFACSDEVGGYSSKIIFFSGGSATFKSTVNIEFDSSQVVGLQLKNASTGTAARIYYGSSIVGSITNTTSATAYNTSSDYRLKENVVDITNGITRVKQLQPKRFNFIVDPTTSVDGFLAHEAQSVIPEAVTGEKDGEEMQGIDQSKLVPLLTAALQEAIAKIETLETKVAALEGS